MEFKTSYDTLVLSGCSTKGFILLGALQYAMDAKMLSKIETYIGTSAGAFICYLMCIGYSPLDIIVYLSTNQTLERMHSLNIIAMLQGKGASSFQPLQEHLEKLSIDKLGYLPTLKSLKDNLGKKFVCVTYNLSEDKCEYLSADTYPDMPCLTALRMSANLPFIFDTFKYGKHFYIDGGIVDNFALPVAESYGEKVLGVLINPLEPTEYIVDGSKMDTAEYLYKLIFIPVYNITQKIVAAATDKSTVIELKSCLKKKFFNFDLGSTEKLELYVDGYNQMKKICTS